jgi:hypothetical protein
MQASGHCGNGVRATAKIDHFSKQGRIRGNLWLFAYTPAKLRMDAISPFGVNLATLTSDGARFSLADLRDKRFLVGPATSCNIARLTGVPIPPHALVGLLRGQAPVLKHEESAATIEWSRKGYYVVTIPSTRDATEEIHVGPAPEDMALPWESQRFRVYDVQVNQRGRVLYHAELKGHAATETDKPRVDDLHIEPDVPPSGPDCQAEIPRRIHLEVPGSDQDVLFQYEDVKWNPPIEGDTFTQPEPPGMHAETVTCVDE